MRREARLQIIAARHPRLRPRPCPGQTIDYSKKAAPVRAQPELRRPPLPDQARARPRAQVLRGDGHGHRRPRSGRSRGLRPRRRGVHGDLGRRRLRGAPEVRAVGQGAQGRPRPAGEVRRDRDLHLRVQRPGPQGRVSSSSTRRPTIPGSSCPIPGPTTSTTGSPASTIRTTRPPTRSWPRSRPASRSRPTAGWSASPRTRPPGRSTYHWSQELPHSTYLIFLAAAPYVVVRDSYETLPVNYWVYPGDEAKARPTYGKTPDDDRVLQRDLRIRLSLAEVRPDLGPARRRRREHLGHGHDPRGSWSRRQDEPDFSAIGIVSHELAHQWWGDLITLRSWGHAWMNESFGTYSDYLYHRHDKGDDEGAVNLQGKLTAYLREAKTRYIRPIVSDRYDKPGGHVRLAYLSQGGPGPAHAPGHPRRRDLLQDPQPFPPPLRLRRGGHRRLHPLGQDGHRPEPRLVLRPVAVQARPSGLRHPERMGRGGARPSASRSPRSRTSPGASPSSGSRSPSRSSRPEGRRSTGSGSGSGRRRSNSRPRRNPCWSASTRRTTLIKEVDLPQGAGRAPLPAQERRRHRPDGRGRRARCASRTSPASSPGFPGSAGSDPFWAVRRAAVEALAEAARRRVAAVLKKACQDPHLLGPDGGRPGPRRSQGQAPRRFLQGPLPEGRERPRPGRGPSRPGPDRRRVARPVPPRVRRCPVPSEHDQAGGRGGLEAAPKIGLRAWEATMKRRPFLGLLGLLALAAGPGPAAPFPPLPGRQAGLDHRSAFLAVGLSPLAPAFSAFTVDSLGRGRLGQNPVLPPTEPAAGVELDGLAYKIHGRPVWQVAWSERTVTLRSDYAVGVEAPAFALTFDQKANHATLLGLMKPGERRMSLPCVLHLPDMGTVRITGNAGAARLRRQPAVRSRRSCASRSRRLRRSRRACRIPA